MNLILKLSAVLFFTIATSCDSAKSTVQEKETNTNAVKEMDTKLVNEGYVAGTVKYLEKSECSYILVDEKLDLKYDPINIDEEKFASFKTDDRKVYFKFLPLRRMNRCNEASPIQLIDIQLRSN